MRARKIRERLAQGPATWQELAEVSNYDEHRCMIEVNRLERECGCTIERRQVTQIKLMYDPENPTARFCGWPECRVPLRLHNGTGYCAVHTQAEARRRWHAMSPDERAEMVEEVCGDSAALLALVGYQFELDGCAT